MVDYSSLLAALDDIGILMSSALIGLVGMFIFRLDELPLLICRLGLLRDKELNEE